jgi:nitroimidazol reductase NimA-like FMN-containing flavoprotein (pyridoxamine 5'-phosphate oxidase superfamily)
MSSAIEVRQAAQEVVSGNKYLVLATASPGATPWVTPVYFAHAGMSTFCWVSRPTSRHSRLVAANPQVAITIFDSSVAIGRAAAVYAEAWAEECTPEDAAREIHHYSERSQHHGVEPWTTGQVAGQAAFRLYRARASSVWLLPDDEGPDHRIPVADLAVLNGHEDRYRRLDDLLPQ